MSYFPQFLSVRVHCWYIERLQFKDDFVFYNCTVSGVSKCFLVNSIVSFKCRITLYANKNSLTLSFPIFILFVPFSCLVFNEIKLNYCLSKALSNIFKKDW